MNIILIEDETDILQGMKEAVQDMGDRFGRIFAASDAEAALELITRHRPDIVVTDIVLPKMTGLDLMEHILEESYRPKIIVISGYSSFSYAQRSIQLGAIDYMLKPFAREDFIRKMGSVVEMIEEEREIGAAVRASDANAVLGAKTLRDKFLLGLCTNPIPLHEHTVHRLKFFELEWMAGESFSVIAIDRAEPDDAALSEKETELRAFAIGNIVEDVLLAYPASVTFHNIHNQWIVVTACEALEELTDAISSAVLTYQRMKLKIGVSRRTSSFQSIADAYEQAVQAMKLSRLEKPGHRLFYAEIEAFGLGGRSQNEYELIAEYIYLDRAGAIREAVSAVVNGFVVSVGGRDRQALIQKCMEWVVHVHSRLSDKLNITLQQISIQLWVDLERCESIERLKAYLVEHFARLSQQISAAPMNPIAEKALRLIQSRYGQNLTLQSLATELATHPVWLSQLFKRETGQTFSGYLADIRMEEAKRLLRESNLKIYEIAEAVGYTDLQHFGQLFKKRTGLTPKEFRSGR